MTIVYLILGGLVLWATFHVGYFFGYTTAESDPYVRGRSRPIETKAEHSIAQWEERW